MRDRSADAVRAAVRLETTIPSRPCGEAGARNPDAPTSAPPLLDRVWERWTGTAVWLSRTWCSFPALCFLPAQFGPVCGVAACGDAEDQSRGERATPRATGTAPGVAEQERRRWVGRRAWDTRETQVPSCFYLGEGTPVVLRASFLLTLRSGITLGRFGGTLGGAGDRIRVGLLYASKLLSCSMLCSLHSSLRTTDFCWEGDPGGPGLPPGRLLIELERGSRSADRPRWAD